MQIVEREKRVAFLGLSNWALDPAKMNRGIMVARSDPDVEELVLSAKGICSDKVNDPIKMRMEPYIEHLAEAYISVCKKQTRDFFGLRDFYRCVYVQVLLLLSVTFCSCQCILSQILCPV